MVLCETVLGSAGATKSAGGEGGGCLVLDEEVLAVVVDGEVRGGVRGDAMLSLALARLFMLVWPSFVAAGIKRFCHCIAGAIAVLLGISCLSSFVLLLQCC